MTMNLQQKNKLFEVFTEEIMNDKYVHDKGPFNFEVFSSDDSSKIVIKLFSNEDLIMHYVIDYQSQTYLKECTGTNGDNSKFSLNCESLESPSRIFYRLDEKLTTFFNDKFNSK